jgi:hypothetical protein
MLCPATLPDGCKCGEIKIGGSQIDAAYACTAGPTALRVTHVSAATPGAKTTGKFAVAGQGAGVPAPLVDAVAQSLTAEEGKWQWLVATPTVAMADQVTDDGNAADWTDASRVLFAQGNELLRANRSKQAMDVFIKLARDTPKPRPGVLGALVAALASQAPDEAAVDAYAAQADANPKDLLDQFLAGVAAHYCGHRNQPTREGKLRMYTKAITYLLRTLPDYDDEPRVHIYLAVSHYRLGDRDADAFYCQAEVYHLKNQEKAIAGIRKYISLTEDGGKKRDGSIVSNTKQERVHKMLDTLLKLKPGEQAPPDMFDPIVVEHHKPDGSAAKFFAPGVLGIALVAGTLVTLWYLRRRKQ